MLQHPEFLQSLRVEIKRSPETDADKGLVSLCTGEPAMKREREYTAPRMP